MNHALDQPQSSWLVGFLLNNNPQMGLHGDCALQHHGPSLPRTYSVQGPSHQTCTRGLTPIILALFSEAGLGWHDCGCDVGLFYQCPPTQGPSPSSGHLAVLLGLQKPPHTFSHLAPLALLAYGRQLLI